MEPLKQSRCVHVHMGCNMKYGSDVHERRQTRSELFVFFFELGEGFFVLFDLQLCVLEQVLSIAVKNLKALLQLCILIVGARRTRHRAC